MVVTVNGDFSLRDEADRLRQDFPLRVLHNPPLQNFGCVARKYLDDTARIYGVSLKKGTDQADDDWDACEFYSKTNPGL